jgi:transposase-like protein
LEPGRARRRYSKEFKADLVEQCRGLGVSMARVAMAHGINANLLRRWVVESTGQALGPAMSDANAVDTASPPAADRAIAPASATFVPVKVKTTPKSDLLIEIARGDVHVKVVWPLDAGAASAAWLRELLR